MSYRLLGFVAALELVVVVSWYDSWDVLAMAFMSDASKINGSDL